MTKARFAIFGKSLLRGVVAITVFLILWEVGSRSKHWLPLDSFAWLRDLLAMAGWDKKYLPWIGAVPAPSEVLAAWLLVVGDAGYWMSWYKSFTRVMGGFLVAMLVGIPFGLLLAVSRTAFGIGFPVFEVLRPIPPLAWVPASIIFWPTQEMSITFVTFLGAFFTIVINVLGGARSIDVRYYQAAQSMGSSNWDIFRRIVLPGTLPSILVGSAVGMGITWEVVVAAEMIGRRQPDRRHVGRRPRLLHLELVRGRVLPADRRRHGEHRHRGVHLERASAAPRAVCNALAPAEIKVYVASCYAATLLRRAF
jgi:NitT/TauT family transport system permease protein